MYTDVEQRRYTTVVYNDNMEILIYPEKLMVKVQYNTATTLSKTTVIF